MAQIAMIPTEESLFGQRRHSQWPYAFKLMLCLGLSNSLPVFANQTCKLYLYKHTHTQKYTFFFPQCGIHGGGFGQCCQQTRQQNKLQATEVHAVNCQHSSQQPTYHNKMSACSRSKRIECKELKSSTNRLPGKILKQHLLTISGNNIPL